MIPEIEVMPAPDDDHCCGCCVKMEYEDAYGFGWCELQKAGICCGDYCEKFNEK